MAGRSSYTDEQKAFVYTVLVANDFNVKRTARETDTPENTVRRWRDEWKQDGPPGISEEAKAEVEDYLAEMRSARDQALQLLRKKMHQATPQQLAVIYGVLSDKIARAEGVGQNDLHVHHHLPKAEELRELFSGFVEQGQEQAALRAKEILDENIVDGEYEPVALPAATNAE